MVKFWILHGIKNGILTTKYPKKKPTEEEIPARSVPPFAAPESNWIQGQETCPTDAIENNTNSLDLGRCIYCRHCSDAGFIFDDNPEDRHKSLQAKISQNELIRKEVAGIFSKKTNIFRKSFHILMIDVGSCNACNLEVLNLSNPYYDLTRLGIFFTNSPKHADVLVVVGALNKAMVDVLKQTYDSMPEPKLVISIGACAISGGIFKETESFVSSIDKVIPVDVTVPGCPPSPIQILQGLLLCMNKIEKDERIPGSKGGL